ncbi:MAG: hypothetical protein CMP23_16885 [Rickettsiales bacterium]|nr:hypothetical protein [Rickettsiales bacterium]
MNAQRDSGGPQRSLRTMLRDNLVAGILVAAPIAVVLWVFNKLVLSMDGVLALVPQSIRSLRWTPPLLGTPTPILETPGLGFFLTVILVVMLGVLARGYFGRTVLQRLAVLVEQVPLLGTIYSATRQLLEAVFSSRAQNFQRVVLVEFPRKGCYCLGFLTAEAWQGVQQAVGSALVSVFVPTTPNPTSGFFVLYPRDELRVLNMTVEEAFKAIMSSGIVAPRDGGLADLEVSEITAEVAVISGEFEMEPS